MALEMGSIYGRLPADVLQQMSSPVRNTTGDAYRGNGSQYMLDENGEPVMQSALGFNESALGGDFQSLQSKFNSFEDYGDGTYGLTLQRPGEDKYSLMNAVYARDPSTGELVLQGDPTNYQQQSSLTASLQGIGKVASFVGGGALLAPAAAGGLGLGAMLGSNAAAGALVGGGGALLSGGDSQAALRGAVLGGIGGGVQDYFGAPATAEAMPGEFSANAFPDEPAYYGGESASGGMSPAPWANAGPSPFFAPEMSMAPWAGTDLQALLGPTYLEGATPSADRQSIDINGQRPPASIPDVQAIPPAPSLGLSAADMAQPTPSKGTAPAEEAGPMDKVKDWLAANPKLARAIFSGAGGLLGAGGSGGGGGGGAQTFTGEPVQWNTGGLSMGAQPQWQPKLNTPGPIKPRQNYGAGRFFTGG